MTDTGIFRPIAEEIVVVESDLNSYGNPYTLGASEGIPVYTVTTPSRKRMIELYDEPSRIMVTRYSPSGSEDWGDEEWELHRKLSKARSPDPEAYSHLDSFTSYWGRDRPLTFDEIDEIYGQSSEMIPFLLVLNDPSITIEEQDMLESILFSIEQNYHWDACFIREFRERLIAPENAFRLMELGVTCSV